MSDATFPFLYVWARLTVIAVLVVLVREVHDLRAELAMVEMRSADVRDKVDDHYAWFRRVDGELFTELRRVEAKAQKASDDVWDLKMACVRAR